MKRKRRRSEGGNVLIEFALVGTFLIPLMLGTVTLGLNLSRMVQVTQVARDAGHMYARFVDFSLASNKNVLVRLAQGLGMTVDGGKGVVIMSKVTFIDHDACAGAGLTDAECTNLNHHVIVHRIVVGNASLKDSTFGTPAPGIMDASGNVTDYLTDYTARATGFSSFLTLGAGEFAFVAEAFFEGAAFSLSGVSNSLYTRAFF